ncbi:MAG: stalk domain-containing protein [Clostridia bacterium]
MKKKIVAIILIIANLFVQTVFAKESNISILTDGDVYIAKDANGNNVYPILKNGTTYLPVRAMAKLVGKSVLWDGETKSVVLGKMPENISVDGKVNVYVDGKLLEMKDAEGKNVDAFIENGTTYVPVRAICESLDLSVEWIDSKKAVSVKTGEVQARRSYTIKDNSGTYLGASEGGVAFTNEAYPWIFTKNASFAGGFSVFDSESGKCLNIRNASQAEGSEVMIYAGGNGANENWKIVKENGNTYIYSKYADKYLAKDNEKLYITENKYPWTVELLPEKDHEIAQEYVAKDLGFATLSTDRLYTITNKEGEHLLNNTQGWYLTSCNPAGYYTITHVETGKNVNVSGASKDVGAIVITWNAGNANNEKWGFIPSEGGYKITGLDNKNFIDNSKMTEDGDVWFLNDIGEYVKAENDGQDVLKDYITPFKPEAVEVIDEETGIVHPGVGLTKNNLDVMQKRVREGTEPWLGAFESFAKTGRSSKTPFIRWNGEDEYINIPWNNTGYNHGRWMAEDGSTAFNQAVMWYITGDEVYRKNAMYILRGWSQMQSISALYDEQIRVSVGVLKMCAAAEILRYADCENEELNWTDDDTAKFTHMLELTKDKYDRWWHFMNQHVMCTNAMMASGIFRNNLEDYAKGVERITANKESTSPRSGSINMQIRKVTKNIVTGEEVEPNIQVVEMGRDMGHAYGNVDCMGTSAAIIYYQGTLVSNETGEIDPEGVNIFNYLDDRLLAGVNYILKYNLGNQVEYIPTGSDGDGFYASINDLNVGRFDAGWGIVYNYYKYIENKDMTADDIKYVTKVYEMTMPEGTNDDCLAASTLLFTPDCAAETYVKPEKDIRRLDTDDTWQIENFTALNYGEAEVREDDEFVYASVKTDRVGSRIAYTNGYFPKASDYVVLRVRTTGDVKISITNENISNLPFAEGIIPSTNGQWKTVMLSVNKGAPLRQRMMFLAFEGEGNIDIDYMQLVSEG